jgi:hypothetical protein
MMCMTSSVAQRLSASPTTSMDSVTVIGSHCKVGFESRNVLLRSVENSIKPANFGWICLQGTRVSGGKQSRKSPAQPERSTSIGLQQQVL